MVFGERLRQLREGRYTQEDLADILKVNNNTISKWENGTQEPRAKRVTEIARILGTTTAYLLGDTDEMKEKETEKTEEKSGTSEIFDKLPLKESAQSLIYERNGERLELPPTEESYAIFREIAMKIAGREIAGVATA